MLIVMIFFTIKDAKLYVSTVTISTKHNRKISKLLRKRFERSTYWNENKIENENKNIASVYRCFLQSNLKFVRQNK